MTKEELLLYLSHPLAHTCKGSKLQCCNVFRCEVCHVQHMQKDHDIKDIYAYEKFHTTDKLIKGNENRVKDTTPTQRRIKKQTDSLKDLFDNIGSDRYEELKSFVEEL